MSYWTLREKSCETILGAIKERGEDYNVSSLVSFLSFIKMTVVLSLTVTFY